MSFKPVRARVAVAAIRIMCPHCDARIQNTEGKDHNETVSAQAGICECSSCGGLVVIPDMSPVFDQQAKLHLRWPRVWRSSLPSDCGPPWLFEFVPRRKRSGR